MSALYRYACEMYDYMMSHAKQDEETEESIYEGKLKEAFTSTGASTRYYTPVKSILDSPDIDPCITVLRRGSGTTPSLVRLNHPPVEGLENVTIKDLTGNREAATLVPELERRMERLEGWREQFGEVNLSEALRDLDNRLSKLEGVTTGRKSGNGKAKK